MTKSDLVERIAEKLDVTKKEAEAIVNVVFGSIAVSYTHLTLPTN